MSDRKQVNYIEYYLPFYMMLTQYNIGGISVAFVGLVFVALLEARKNKGIIAMPKYYGVWALVSYLVVKDVIVIALNPIAFDTYSKRIVLYVLYFAVCSVVTNIDFDEDHLFRVWKIAAVFFIAGLIYHLVLVYVFGIEVTPISIIPGVSIREGIYSTRPTSFFAEPEIFAVALLPLLFMSLRRQDIKWSIISTLVIVASTSSTGIILMLVLWVIFIFSKTNRRWIKFVAVLFFVIGIFAILYFPIFDQSLLKMEQVVKGESTFVSRVSCGLGVIRALNPLELIFGTKQTDAYFYVGQNIDKFSTSSYLDSAVRFFFENNSISHSIFLNTFSNVIFRYGIIGLILYYGMFFKRIRTKNYPAKSLLVAYIVGTFGQTSFLNSIGYLTIILMFLYEKKMIKEEDGNFGEN